MTYRAFGRGASIVGVLGLLVSMEACAMQPRVPRSYGRAGQSSGATLGWQGFRVGNGLDVVLPKQPAWTTERGRANDGAVVTSTQAECALPHMGLLFRVYVLQFEGGISGDLTDQLDGIVDGFIEGAEDMEVREAETITTRGFPGVELELYDAENRIVMRTRHYIGRSRAYTVVAARQERGGDTTAEQSVDYFFDHLVLDANDAPVPAGDARVDLVTWTTIFPPDDDFAIQMPGRALTDTRPFTLGTDTSETTVYRVGEVAGPTRFAVNVTPLGQISIEGLLARLRDQRLAEGYRIRDARDSHRQGYAALAVTYESQTSVMYSLYVLTLARIYEAQVVVPLAGEADATAHRARFFQSLRIL